MGKKPPPPLVRFAMLIGDSGSLSRMGTAGTIRKEELKELDKKRKAKEEERSRAKKLDRKTFKRLAGSWSMARQANEHICPID